MNWQPHGLGKVRRDRFSNLYHGALRMIFRLGETELDDQTLTLTRAGQRVLVQRRVFDLIHYLVRHRDRVVTDRELFENVWAGVAVTRASIAHAAMKARRALGDLGRAPTMIESVRGRGLRFIGEVVDVSGSSPSGASIQAGGAAAVTAPDAQTDLVRSFSTTTESMFELARQMDRPEFEQTLSFLLLVLPSQASGGNPWALETASASLDQAARPADVPARIEVFELWGLFDGPPVLTVGRTRACNIVVRAPSISKQHARFHLEPELVLEDLGSHNGTRVNGELLVSSRKAVRSGDIVHFGRVVSWIMSAAALHDLIHRMDATAGLRIDPRASGRGAGG